MFDFKEPEDGSEARFHERVDVWTGKAPPIDPEQYSSAAYPWRPEINPHGLPKVKHYFWWLLHNLVAHPAIGIAPVRPAFEFHDWTSRKLNGL